MDMLMVSGCLPTAPRTLTLHEPQLPSDQPAGLGLSL